MAKTLTKAFFNRPTLAVAHDLLGKYIVRRIPASRGKPARVAALMITEVEAYDGPHDRASHAYRGRVLKSGRANRAAIMFGDAGNLYVYFTYGMHWLVNVVTGPRDYPAAILIRGTDAVKGPARLTKFLKIDRTLNGKPATHYATGLWFEDRGVRIPCSRIVASRRIGVDYAGLVWAKKEWNFELGE